MAMDEERTLISLKIPKNLLNSIDSKVKSESDKYSGRTDFLLTAARYYLSLIRCPKCATLNDKEARACWNCGECLDKFHQDTKEIKEKSEKLLNEMEQIREVCKLWENKKDRLDYWIKKENVTRKDFLKQFQQIFDDGTTAMNKLKLLPQYFDSLGEDEEPGAKEIRFSIKDEDMINNIKNIKLNLKNAERCETLSEEKRGELKYQLTALVAVFGLYLEFGERSIGLLEFADSMLTEFLKSSKSE